MLIQQQIWCLCLLLVSPAAECFVLRGPQRRQPTTTAVFESFRIGWSTPLDGDDTAARMADSMNQAIAARKRVEEQEAVLAQERFERELEEFRVARAVEDTTWDNYGEVQEFDHYDYWEDDDEIIKDDIRGRYQDPWQQDHPQETKTMTDIWGDDDEEEEKDNNVDVEEEDDDAIVPELMDMNHYKEGHQNVVDDNYESSSYPSPSPDFRKEDTRKHGQKKKSPPEPEPLMGKVQVEQQSTLSYSITNAIRPGSVADISSGILQEEVREETDAPLLLYCYNQWFGPCLEMTSEIESVAFRIGTKVRIAKLNADKYPAVVQHYGVSAQPALLLMNGPRVLHRSEGSLQTEAILAMLERFL